MEDVNNSVDVAIPLPENMVIDPDNFYVEHEHTENRRTTVRYYKVTMKGSVAHFTVPYGFSKFTFESNNKKVTIAFEDDSVFEKTFTLSDIGFVFPTVDDSGKPVDGWNIIDENGRVIYRNAKTFTKDMFDELATEEGAEYTAEPCYKRVRPEGCDHDLNSDGVCRYCGVKITLYPTEKPTDETNPNTGAPSAASSAAIAIAVLSAAAVCIGKKR